VSRVGDKVILEPIEKPPFDVKAWRARLRAMGAGDFLPRAALNSRRCPTATSGSTDPPVMFCLDTGAVIAVLNERIASVAERFDTEITKRTKILVSTIVIYELR
jgi:hypothetical protein